MKMKKFVSQNEASLDRDQESESVRFEVAPVTDQS